MSKNTETAPLLPPASVDFNKLHDQCKAGRLHETAVKNAVFEETVVEIDEGVEVPAADQGTVDEEQETNSDVIADEPTGPVATTATTDTK